MSAAASTRPLTSGQRSGGGCWQPCCVTLQTWLFLFICSHDQLVPIISLHQLTAPRHWLGTNAALHLSATTGDLHCFWSLRQQVNYLHQVFTDVGVSLDRWSDGLGTSGADERWDVMHLHHSSRRWSDPCGMGLHRHGSLHRSSWFGSWSSGGVNLSLLVTPLSSTLLCPIAHKAAAFTHGELEPSWSHNNTLWILPNDSVTYEHVEQEAKQIWKLDCNKAQRCFPSKLPGAFKPRPGEREKLHEHVKLNMEG